MGKINKTLLEGKVAKIHRDNEIIPTEMVGIVPSFSHDYRTYTNHFSWRWTMEVV